LVGVADLVEFHPAEPDGAESMSFAAPSPRPSPIKGEGGIAVQQLLLPEPPGEIPYPIEYKRGKRRRWDNDDVQLCAQALCLEEMLTVPVPRGAIFHLKSRRRREVVFDAALRRATSDTAARLHELLDSGVTPPPVLHPKCRQCSLHAVCLPELISAPAAYRLAATALFTVADDPASTLPE
jgi:CRISPR-associated exonuclease Cas4